LPVYDGKMVCGHRDPDVRGCFAERTLTNPEEPDFWIWLEEQVLRPERERKEESLGN